MTLIAQFWNSLFYCMTPASNCFQAPNERARLYFLLAWFHAIIQERMRYTPLGWAKKYEFTESDLRVACDMLDTWVDSVAMVSTNWSSSALWVQSWASVTYIYYKVWSVGLSLLKPSDWKSYWVFYLKSNAVYKIHCTWHNYGYFTLQILAEPGIWHGYIYEDRSCAAMDSMQKLDQNCKKKIMSAQQSKYSYHCQSATFSSWKVGMCLSRQMISDTYRCYSSIVKMHQNCFRFPPSPQTHSKHPCFHQSHFALRLLGCCWHLNNVSLVGAQGFQRFITLTHCQGYRRGWNC